MVLGEKLMISWYEIKSTMKIFLGCTIGLVLFIFSFYPLEVWAGSFFLELLPPYLTTNNFWMILADATWLLMGAVFLTAFVIFLRIVWKN